MTATSGGASAVVVKCRLRSCGRSGTLRDGVGVATTLRGGRVVVGGICVAGVFGGSTAVGGEEAISVAEEKGVAL
jgi:hypothetical protein